MSTNQTTDLDQPLTCFERGIVARTIGASPDTECLDDDEAADYLRGYSYE